MNRRIVFAVASIAFTWVAMTPPPAAAQALEMAKTIPVQLAEATSGGVWTEGEKTGVYRVMTLVVADGEATATHVIAQWLQLEEGKPEPTVVETVAIKEVNDQNLQGAFVALETEKDNEASVVVSSYDPIEDDDISINVRLTTPGKYEIVKQ
jgi:hypothetical protein